MQLQCILVAMCPFKHVETQDVSHSDKMFLWKAISHPASHCPRADIARSLREAISLRLGFVGGTTWISVTPPLDAAP